MQSNDDVKARAEAALNNNEPAADTKPPDAMDEYRARQDAERAKMAKLNALRLAAEAKAGGEPKAKRKPRGKGKRL
jgi:hypothetical protein